MKTGLPNTHIVLFAVICGLLISACDRQVVRYEISFQGEYGIQEKLFRKIPDIEPDGYVETVALGLRAEDFNPRELTFDEFLWIEIFPCDNRTWDNIQTSAVYFEDELMFVPDTSIADNDGLIFGVFSQDEIEDTILPDTAESKQLCAGLRYHEPYGVSKTSNAVSILMR